MPNFQNPTGVTLSEQRRRRLVELAREYNFFIIEDDPYGELRYSGDPIDMIISFDMPKGNEGNTIYIGTFSKTVAPGLRIGWAVGPENLIRKMVVAKQALDLCTDTFSQALIAEYLKRGLMDDHNERIRNLYRHKPDWMYIWARFYWKGDKTRKPCIL